MQPQRLLVPLFQRPYVWNEDIQWEPLWDDIERLAERWLAQPQGKHQPHFLGAVVLQQIAHQTGQMQQRTIIDGQQRLTTLQLLFDALHAELTELGASQAALRIKPLIENDQAYCSNEGEKFKVSPTNRDRPHFNQVMGAQPPISYDALAKGERMIQAHRFFASCARKWLELDGPDGVQRRANALDIVVRDLLQLVVIDLAADENAQEIFETLNARGEKLTAADLIKNFVFQRLAGQVDVEAVYEQHWKSFENTFWEEEVSSGRQLYPRSAVFLNHWLIAETGEEIVARKVFERFKRYADHDAGVPMLELLKRISASARVYKDFLDSAAEKTGLMTPLALFGYRTSVLESEVVKPLVLYLLDPNRTKVPQDQFERALNSIESWMVRRMLVRETTKNYNKIVADLIAEMRKQDRQSLGDFIAQYLQEQRSESSYLPDDDEVQNELGELMVYRRLKRGRLRMVLEALEDHFRGFNDPKGSYAEGRVARSSLAIEHIMPRRWSAHWPVGETPEPERDRLVHTLGNLTLLNGKLNSKVSNGPWQGVSGKREGLKGHSVLKLNARIVENETWPEATIVARTKELVRSVLAIWPVPPGYKSEFQSERRRPHRKVELADLIAGNEIAPFATLTPSQKKHSHRTAKVLADGRVEVDGKSFAGPTEAASYIRGKRTGGWWFFFVDPEKKTKLKHLKQQYVEKLSVDIDDDEEDGDEDE